MAMFPGVDRNKVYKLVLHLIGGYDKKSSTVEVDFAIGIYITDRHGVGIAAVSMKSQNPVGHLPEYCLAFFIRQ